MNFISKYFVKKELSNLINVLNIMRDYCYNYYGYTFLSSESNNIQRELNYMLDMHNEANYIKIK